MSMSMERLEEALAKEEATNVQLRTRIAELEAEKNIRNTTLDEIVLFIENYVEGYDRDYRELGLELAAEIQARKT